MVLHINHRSMPMSQTWSYTKAQYQNFSDVTYSSKSIQHNLNIT
ncbi:hypothetical protein F383_30641 [Gossypium arboreum]|uniref:Uncharacterized protein n=1 Tax=Gossypium arboreum TaxID=29729 RepID=A0A0B0PFE7_GOSAR|nr:hypothetical protein F383_30641 [Gossypium arboreum]